MPNLAATTAQVLVDDTIVLPLPAVKVDEIAARVMNLECFVITDKVIFQGILHKQIFFVDMDGVVRHVGVDIPFSGFSDIPGVTANSTCQLTADIAFLNFNLVSPTELRETVVIDVGITITGDPVSPNVVTSTIPAQLTRFGPAGMVRFPR